MIERIEQRGVLIGESSLAGERRADNVFPAHPNGIPMSGRTWLILYATRGWRCVDDDRSILYQLRRDAPDGALVKEGMFAQSVDDWDVLGDGRRFVRQHGHPVAFGVPKGALMHGQPAPHANVFVAKWRRVAAGCVNPDTGLLDRVNRLGDVRRQTQSVEWVQFRLNDAEDDLVILQTPRTLRQKGYESGPAFCRHADAGMMNQSFVQAVPFNSDGSEWVDVNHFDQRRIAVLKYRFDTRTGLYEWVEVSPFMETAGWRLMEGSIACSGPHWVIAARSNSDGRQQKVGWVKTENPFEIMPAATFVDQPVLAAPLTMYACPDGQLRLFTGDPKVSPYRNARDPLYGWEINPADFSVGSRHEIFDSVKAGLLEASCIPRVDMGKLLPHTGGAEQYFVYRVRVKAVMHPYGSLPPITEELKAKCAIYYAKIHYSQAYPRPSWEVLAP